MANASPFAAEGGVFVANIPAAARRPKWGGRVDLSPHLALQTPKQETVTPKPCPTTHACTALEPTPAPLSVRRLPPCARFRPVTVRRGGLARRRVLTIDLVVQVQRLLSATIAEVITMTAALEP